MITATELMDDDHFLAVWVPATPRERELLERVAKLAAFASEEFAHIEWLLEAAEGRVDELKEELEGVRAELAGAHEDLEAAENRIEELELELLNQGESK